MSRSVRIYRPAKSAMQSGRAGTCDWILEHDVSAGRCIDPLMGWVGSHNTKAQIRLKFHTRTDAEAYASKHGLQYRVEEPHERTVRPKNYADNFTRPKRYV